MAEVELELHDPVVLDREDREGRRALEAVVREDDVRRAVTVTTPPDRSAWSAIWTDLVTPCRVRSPVAVAVITTQSAGTAASWIGAVSLNVAVGNWEVWIPWRSSCPSRRESSLLRLVRSALIWTTVIDVPATVSEPVTLGVRPTAVLAPTPASCSFTR